MQMIALFRDYDVIWPGATNTALGWFEIVNVGLSMAAPGGLLFCCHTAACCCNAVLLRCCPPGCKPAS